MLDKGRETTRQRLGHGPFAGRVQCRRYDQRPRIVIHAIPMRPIGYGKECVLEQARVIAHRAQVVELNGGEQRDTRRRQALTCAPLTVD